LTAWKIWGGIGDIIFPEEACLLKYLLRNVTIKYRLDWIWLAMQSFVPEVVCYEKDKLYVESVVLCKKFFVFVFCDYVAVASGVV
jgi:hypothetical protein